MNWYLPETAHPGSRGVDRMLDAERAKLGTSDGATDQVRWRWVWLNPFASLALLRAPNLLAVVGSLLSIVPVKFAHSWQTIGGTLVLLTDFILGIPMAYTLGKRYNLDSAALVGLLFIPAGIGSFIGAPLAGRLSDRAIVRGRAKRQGVWVPEDRLRAALVSAGLLAPLSIILSGLITRYVPRHVGLGLNIVVLFINGLAVDMTLTPSAAYCIDVLQSHSAEVTSSTK
jgi:MFS family permease